MELADRVAVCCPGRTFSVANVPADMEVAAINVALKHAGDRCRWWICYDAPNDVHALAIGAFLRLRPTVVTLEERVEPWKEWFANFAKLPRQSWPSIEVADGGPLWYRVATKEGPVYSATTAVAWALWRRIRHLHYVGAEMAGVGYCDPAANDMPQNSAKERMWGDRWSGERKMMSISQKVCWERGYLRITGLPWVDPPEEFPPPPVELARMVRAR